MTGFAVGDRVGQRASSDCRTGTVVIGKPDRFHRIVVEFDGEYQRWTASNCELVPTFSERWINVYPKPSEAYTSFWETRAKADRMATDNRIGVIHLHSDGTVEMEAP